MIAVSFHGHAGWLHDADGDVAVVLCGAQGYEELCTQRGWYELAQSLAERGFPTLRFDYAGCGDSLGSDTDHARLPAWQDSIAQAVAFVRETLGVTKVVLVGLRLGALLAMQHALGDPAIAGVALLGAPVSGRGWAREMQMLAKVVGVPPEDAAPWPKLPDGFELGGFRYLDETLTSLAALPKTADLLAVLAARHCLVLEKVPSAGSDRPPNHIALPFDGYDTYCIDRMFSVVPDSALRAVGDWLEQHWPQPRSGPVTRRALPNANLSGAGFAERLVQFGLGAALAGIICTPAAHSPAKAIIITNTGANHHIGWGRGTVELARGLAQNGIATLRLDLAGLGNSATLPSRASPPLYTADAVADVQAAVDWLKAAGFAQIGVLGACSGAWLALRSALADPRIGFAIMINLNRFVWPQGACIEDAVRNVYRSSRAYASKATDPRSVLRLLRGEVAAGAIARALLGRAARKLKALYRRAAMRLPLLNASTNIPRQMLQQLAAQGTRALFIYGNHDGGLNDIELHFGSPQAVTKITGMQFAKVCDADHNFSPALSRLALFEIVATFVGAQPQQEIDAPAPPP